MKSKVTANAKKRPKSNISPKVSERETFQSNVAISYAITYIFGTVGLILFFKLVPKLMRRNLKEEAKALKKSLSSQDSDELDRPELFSWFNQLDLRSYKVEKTAIVGKSVAALEALFPRRIAVDLIKRDGTVFEPNPDILIRADNILGLLAPSNHFLAVEELIGSEVDERAVRDQVGEILKICILNPAVVGKTLGELSRHHGRGIFLKKLTRQGHELPILEGTVLHKCDILQVAGLEVNVERLVNRRPKRLTFMDIRIIHTYTP